VLTHPLASASNSGDEVKEAGNRSGEIVWMQCPNCRKDVWAMLEWTDSYLAAPKPLGRNTYARHFAVCPECEFPAFDHWNWNRSA
jgi:hypothetical protein